MPFEDVGRAVYDPRALSARDEPLGPATRGLRYNTSCGAIRRPVMTARSFRGSRPSDRRDGSGAAQAPATSPRRAMNPSGGSTSRRTTSPCCRPDFEPLMLSVVERRTEADGTRDRLGLLQPRAAARPEPRAGALCNDTMADQTYPYTATLELGDTVLQRLRRRPARPADGVGGLDRDGDRGRSPSCRAPRSRSSSRPSGGGRGHRRMQPI
jgi:hypothetical protein